MVLPTARKYSKTIKSIRAHGWLVLLGLCNNSRHEYLGFSASAGPQYGRCMLFCAHLDKCIHSILTPRVDIAQNIQRVCVVSVGGGRDGDVGGSDSQWLFVHAPCTKPCDSDRSAAQIRWDDDVSPHFGRLSVHTLMSACECALSEMREAAVDKNHS